MQNPIAQASYSLIKTTKSDAGADVYYWHVCKAYSGTEELEFAIGSFGTVTTDEVGKQISTDGFRWANFEEAMSMMSQHKGLFRHFPLAIGGSKGTACALGVPEVCLVPTIMADKAGHPIFGLHSDDVYWEDSWRFLLITIK